MASVAVSDGVTLLRVSELSKIMSSSTLVETVSLNYEDFTEGFLTCGTCLYTYDGDEHSPKLLPCSHTLCRICLIRIASASGVEDPLEAGGAFRCPICREMIQLPRGGVPGLPPSFLVNQLLDLMTSQRREVVPKCSQHVNQELLYCESCDFVFCSLCTGSKHHGKFAGPNGGSSNNSSPTSPNKNNNCEHTVIPFSIAIKRMSEILLYKGQQCVGKLNESAENVLNEMEMLDRNSDHAVEDINRTFQEIIGAVERRRQEMLAQASRIREEKRLALREQLTSIESEKSHLERECSGFKRQVEVRNISKKINDLKEKLESIETMLDPKENCFLAFEHDKVGALAKIDDCLKCCTGNIRTSRTFPAACRAFTADRCQANLRCSVRVVTYDYNGEAQSFGGDPLTASLVNIDASDKNIPCSVVDNRDGTYSIDFIPQTAGIHSMKILIFGRSIKNFPLEFEVSEHINPVYSYGKVKGSGEDQLNQPTAVAVDPEGVVFVLDTGNSRIHKLLSSPESLPFKLEDHFVVDNNSASTGLAYCGRSRSLLVTNWRDRQVKVFDCASGQQVKAISHPDMREPTCVAIGSSGQFAVADNGAGAVFVFYPSGKFNFKIEKQKNTFSVVTGLVFHPDNGDLIVTDTRVLVFDKCGAFLRELFPPVQPNSSTTSLAAAGRSKRVNFSGVAFDSDGKTLLVTKVEGSRSVILVVDYLPGTVKFVIDSMDEKIKRPVCLATIDDHVLLVDLGSNSVKKYRFC